MTEERSDVSSQDSSGSLIVPREAYEELSTGFVVFRRALRDCLGQAGIPSNPLWTDQDIVSAIASKLGVRDTYEAAERFTRLELVRLNHQKSENP